MNGFDKWLCRYGKAFMPAFLSFVLLCTVSCVTTGTKEKATSSAEPGTRETEVFRSSRYVVCLLEKSSSAETLAEQYLGGRERAWVIEEANGADAFEENDTVVIPVREENPGGLEKDGYQVVPILCYHRFAVECKDELCVPAGEFDRQMAFLAEEGYHVITLNDLHEFLHYRSGLPEKAVVITIDDGYRSTYEIAYPILRKYGFTAAVFVYTDFIDAGSKALSWEQIREMKANGFDVGSHTVSHCDLTKPLKEEDDQAYRKRVRDELLKSKQILDEKLAQDTFALAFPYGNMTPGLLQLCQSLGYRLGFTVRPGNNPFFADPLALKRDQVRWNGDPPFEEYLEAFCAMSLE